MLLCCKMCLYINGFVFQLVDVLDALIHLRCSQRFYIIHFLLLLLLCGLYFHVIQFFFHKVVIIQDVLKQISEILKTTCTKWSVKIEFFILYKQKFAGSFYNDDIFDNGSFYEHVVGNFHSIQQCARELTYNFWLFSQKPLELLRFISM